MNIDIHGRHVDISETLRVHVERRLRFALGRLSHRIVRVHVWLTDLNGPRGGIDKRCRIEVVGHKGTVAVEDTDADAYVVIDLAAERIRRMARRLADRERSIDRTPAGRDPSWPAAG